MTEKISMLLVCLRKGLALPDLMLHKSQFNHSSTRGSYYCSIRRAVQTLLGLCINKRYIRVPVLGLADLSDSNFIYCKPIQAIHEQNVHPQYIWNKTKNHTCSGV